MVNITSPGGRGGGQGAKKSKKVSIFFQKRVSIFFQKRYQYFFKNGIFKGGHNVAKRGDPKIEAPPSKQKPSYDPTDRS